MPTCHISLSIPRRLADQKSDSQPLDYSDKILHSNYSKSRFSAKSQEIGSVSRSEIHLYRHGISDATKFSQDSNGSCTEPISDNQENSVIQTCIGTNFPFSFGQTQCCSRLCSPRQTALTSSSDVPFVCLETSYCIMISTDNTTVVSYINKQGGTHSPNLCVEVWRILNWCLEQDIVIRVCHIPGKFNILADRLSRLDKPIKTEWALDQTIANSVFQMLNFPNVDLFATRFYHRLPLYVSPVQDYKALAIDALSMDWNHLHAYAFPPFILIPAVLEKI